MRRVLIVAYYFPPTGGGNVARVHAFTKYLPRNNWQPIILTVDPTYYPPFLKDDTLINLYSNEVMVARTKSLEPKSQLVENLKSNVYGVNHKASSFFQTFSKPLLRHLYRSLIMPDEKILWLPYAIRKGTQLIKQHNVDAILCTTPPHSAGIIGATLSRLTGRPLLLDVRDDWVGSPLLDTGPWHRHLFSKLAERWVVNIAGQVVSTTLESKGQFHVKYPEYAPDKFKVIPNGYDSEEILEVLQEAQNTQAKSEKLRIIYIGGLPTKRTPFYLFKALSELANQYPLEQTLQIDIYGHARQEFIEMRQELNLTQVVNFCGFVSRQESLRQLALAHVGLLIIPNEEGGRTAIPGKIYEYMGAKKYVLALCSPDSAVGRLIKTYSLGLSISHNDVYAIKKALITIIDDYHRDDIISNATPILLKKFDRVDHAQQLADLLTEIAK